MAALRLSAVIDASAMTEVLLPARKNAELTRRLLTSNCVAPEFLDLEVLQVIRREFRCGNLTDHAASLVAKQLENATVYRAPFRTLLKRVWELRHTVTAYDAAYVALAEQLDVPLVTCDARPAKAHGHDARVEFYPRSSL